MRRGLARAPPPLHLPGSPLYKTPLLRRKAVVRRAWVILIAGGLALFSAVVGGAIALTFFDDEGHRAISRPATSAIVTEDAAAVKLSDVDELPPLPPAVRRREVEPEGDRRTPVSRTADPVMASDYGETELQDGNDPRGSGDAFASFQNVVVDKGSGLLIAEPNIASNGDRAMVVWNLGAAFSSDGGATFTYVNPRRAEFPQDRGRFCCDQLALYVPTHDLWVWFLQYYAPANGQGNIVRLAFAKGNEAFDTRTFGYRDLTAESFPALGIPNAFLDYPNIAVTKEHLFLAINAFVGKDYRSTVVMRLPLDEFSEGKPSSFNTSSAMPAPATSPTATTTSCTSRNTSTRDCYGCSAGRTATPNRPRRTSHIPTIRPAS